MIRSTQVMTVAEFRGQGKRSKYGSKKTVIDGRIFASKIEGRRYEQLKQLRAAGEIDHFLCQVPFWMAPGVRYVVDFLIVWKVTISDDADGQRVGYEDVKGHLTDTSRVKILTVEHLYGISINILTKKDIGP